MEKIRKIGKAASALLFAMMVILMYPVSAMADTGGGVGGGGNSGTVTSGTFKWKVIAFDEPGKAWQRFLQEDSRGDSYTISEVNKSFSRAGSSKSGESICKSSNVIWYLERNNNRWHYNYTGFTNGSPSTGYSTISKPAYIIGRAPLQGELDAFYKWDAQNGNILSKAPGYTIVCSGSFMPLEKTTPKIETPGSKTSSTTKKENILSFTAPYSFVTQVTPMKNNKGGNVGSDKLHPQGGGSTKTNFGKLYDSIKGSSMSPSEVESKVKAALAQDKNLDRAAVNLDEANRQGLAEGGILNVNENALNATISIDAYTTTVTKEMCTWKEVWDWNLNGGKGGYKKDPNSKSCEKVSTEQPVEYKAVTTQGTLQPSGFWQILAVKCNPEQLDALIASDKSLTAKVEKSEESSSATINTKKYDKMPKDLDFGDPSNPNKAKAATAEEGFFDKICSFTCTADGSGNNANSQNGAVENVRSNGSGQVSGVEGYGAVSDGKNSKYFEFFRDNEDKSIRPDVWYPTGKGNVTYDGSAPKGTLILRDSEGTPSLDGKNGGEFSMNYSDGEPVFQSKNSAVNPHYGNTSKNILRNSVASYRPGFHDKFTVRSTWASDPNRPQVFNFAWNYAGTISHVIPTGEIGFGPGGTPKTGKTTTVQVPIEGFCAAEFGVENQSHNMQGDFVDFTGTDTAGLNKMFSEKGTLNDDSRNIVVNFVRSTGE